MNTLEDALTKFYSRRHPYYEDLLTHWVFCENTYNGGRAWFEENLFRYLKEGDKEFGDRRARAYRFNHTREAVDLVQKYLFKSPVKRNFEDADEVLKSFWTKATRSGQGIDELARLVSTANSLTGRVALVIDRSRVVTSVSANPAAPMSVREEEELDFTTYSYVVGPKDILDYAWSETDGDLLWIKLREYVRDDASPHSSTGDVRERVRLWTRTGWELYEMQADQAVANAKPKAIMLETGTHGLKRVPVRLCDHSITNHPFKASGLVDDIAYLDRAVANYLSNLDAIIQDQTFSQLAIPAAAIGGDRKTGESQIIEMGTKRIFTYDGGAGSSAKPEFISPDPKQAGVILNVVNKIVNEIYHTIGLAGERTKEDNAVGIDNSSGVAKAYDFERVNSLLLSKAKRMESVENWIVETVLLWAGKPLPSEPYVTYPTSFDVASLGDELATSEALQKVNAPIEVRREQMMSVIEKLLPQVTDVVWAKLKKAIGEWDGAAPEKPQSKTKIPTPGVVTGQGTVKSTTE